MNVQEPNTGSEKTLESWKEIAAYIQRDAKTARRWGKEEGLPIHAQVEAVRPGGDHRIGVEHGRKRVALCVRNLPRHR